MKKLSHFVKVERSIVTGDEQERREKRRKKTRELCERVDAFKKLLDVKDLSLIDEGPHEQRDPCGGDGVVWILSFETDMGRHIIIFNSWNDVVKMGLASDGGFPSYGKHDTEKLLTDLAKLIVHRIHHTRR